MRDIEGTGSRGSLGTGRVVTSWPVRALLVCNGSDADAGFVGERFRDHGYAFTECHRERPGEWPEFGGHDLVVLLGSDWSVYWAHLADEVAAECALIRAVMSAGIPLFGICYGSQIVARALGGHVERAPVTEIGWVDDLSATEAVVGNGPWFEWHADRVATLPPGAERLAWNPAATQAYVIGRAFTTQFHPEVDRSIIDRWAAGGAGELAAAGVDPAALLADTDRHFLGARRRATALVDWFCESAAGWDHAEVVNTR